MYVACYRALPLEEGNQLGVDDFRMHVEGNVRGVLYL
jgi:hypothetical protein